MPKAVTKRRRVRPTRANLTHNEQSAYRFSAESLTSISEAMGGDKSPKEILQLIVRAAFSITRATSASLMLVAPDSDTLSVEVAEGFKGTRIFNTRLRVGQGVTGWVAESGVPLRVGNVRNDPRYVRVQSDLRSELAVPMKIGGAVIGVISVDSTRVDHFTAEDEALLLSLAAQSARVIQTTRLYEEACRRAAELELLSEITRGLSSTLDLRQVLAQAVEQTARVCRAEIVSIFLSREQGTCLEIAASYGGSEDYRQQPPLRHKQTLLGSIIDSGKPTIIADVHAGHRNALWTIDPSVSSLLAVPLVTKGKALGVLCAFGAQGRNFDGHDQRLLENIARSAAMAIENARAHRRMLATEEALRNAEKFSMLGELAAGLAHEIRNPLTSIKVLFGTLRRTASAPDAQQDSEMIERQIARLETIVDGFLSQARSQARAPEMRNVDLNTIVEEALLLLASSSSEGTRLNIELAEGELPVQGDSTQLSQIVYNLVLNAIQAVEKRGRIQVLTGVRQRAGETQPRTFFEVADDGPGLPAQVRERLFQPFVTTKKSGVGLGLSIVKRIADEHDATLEIESPRQDLGRGALFRLWLAPTKH